MKKTAALLLAVIIASCSLCSCIFYSADGLRSKNKIIALYRNNEAAFIAAADSKDFSAIESIKGVRKVSVHDHDADIYCGGSGMGADTDYYGIMWAEYGIESALFSEGGTSYTKIVDGSGTRYEEKAGDNVFYVEPLGNDYYYYELHF